MASLKYKKVYIDTKLKTADSASTSNFKYELPETLYFADNSVFYIDDIAIPHSWWSIEENMNDRLYVYMNNTSDNWSHILTLSPGNYTGVELAAEIQNQLQTVSTNFSCIHNSKKNNLSIILGLTDDRYFKILTPLDLKTKLNGAFYWNYDTNKPNDCNETLSNLEGNSPQYSRTFPFVSGYLNMQPIRNIYIHSLSLGNFSNIGPLGEQTVI